MATKKESTVIEIKPIEVVEVPVRIVGDTPLIMHAWSAKARRMISNPELTPPAKKRTKNPFEDFVTSLYWISEPPTELTEDGVNETLDKGARFGFPVGAIKDASISAAYRMGWTKDKVSSRCSFFVKADTDHYNEVDVAWDGEVTIKPVQNDLVEIKYDSISMREDMVRVGMGSADIRYRGELRGWYADLTIQYNKNGNYTLENILNFLNAGGVCCGLGEMRPEKAGRVGCITLKNARQASQVVIHCVKDGCVLACYGRQVPFRRVLARRVWLSCVKAGQVLYGEDGALSCDKLWQAGFGNVRLSVFSRVMLWQARQVGSCNGQLWTVMLRQVCRDLFSRGEVC